MVIAFLIFISNSGDANQPQLGNRKAKATELWPRCNDSISKAAKHQAHDAADHEVNSIGRFEMDSMLDTCCDGKNWSILSTTG